MHLESLLVSLHCTRSSMGCWSQSQPSLDKVGFELSKAGPYIQLDQHPTANLAFPSDLKGSHVFRMLVKTSGTLQVHIEFANSSKKDLTIPQSVCVSANHYEVNTDFNSLNLQSPRHLDIGILSNKACSKVTLEVNCLFHLYLLIFSLFLNGSFFLHCSAACKF